jgi:hypothetical protein
MDQFWDKVKSEEKSSNHFNWFQFDSIQINSNQFKLN